MDFMRKIDGLEIEPRVETKGVVYPDDTAYDGLYFTDKVKTRYYNYYYSYGRFFKPKSIFEIGVRAGYTGYYLLKGSSALKYRGVDLEAYLPGSNQRAQKLLSQVCKDAEVTFIDSHKLSKLDQLYDLIHVDGDHSYHGKIQDLELALANLAPNGVIVVDDYTDFNPVGKTVKKATDVIIKKYGLKTQIMDTYTGHILLKLDS